MKGNATTCAWAIGALLCGVVSTAHAQNYPITAGQRATAQQVAQQGVPLSALSATAPDSYTVQRGDTLWRISGLFLRQPWRWPELWGMNLQAIANPHLIYPGQVLYLEKSGGFARLRTARHGGTPTVKLSPQVRSESLSDQALPTLQMHIIEAFLSEPLVVDNNTLVNAPRIIAGDDDRMLRAPGDRAYVRAPAAAPLLRQADDSAVVFTIDDPARTSQAYWGGYGIAQAGLEALVSMLHAELTTTPVRVSALRPQPMRSGVRAKAYVEREGLAAADPADFAPACVHLLSPAGAAQRGQVHTPPHPA